MKRVEHKEGYLQWRDLKGDDVYHLAHLEHATRKVMSYELSKIAYEDDPIIKGLAVMRVEMQWENQQTTAEMWLGRQATALGLKVLGADSVQVSL